MSMIDNIKNLNLESSAVVTLTYSQGTDVFVHNESEVETALEETSVVEAFSELLATPGLEAKSTYGGNVLEELRSADLLESYERDFTFSEYLTDVLKENFYDADVIEYATEKFDYKRGFCTLTAKVSVLADNLIEVSPNLEGWNVSIKTSLGVLTLDA